MARLTQSTHATPEQRAFLQQRVGLFGLTAGSCLLLFLVFRVVLDCLDVDYGIAGVVADPTVWYHLLATLCFLATWAFCRVGEHNITTVRWAEALCLLMGSAAIIAICSKTPTHARPDMVLVLALSPILMARTLYVPSSARRTLLLAVAIGAQAVTAAYLVFQGVEPEKWAALDPTIAGRTREWIARTVAWSTGAYWMLTTVIATGASRVIYGLRREVRDAKQLGQYRLDYKIGEGGMGAVYKARHALLRRPTAVKLLLTDLETPANLERFEKEVQQTSRLNHPNIITIFDYGHTPEGVFYYAMEYVDGMTLSTLVEKHGPQPVGRVQLMLIQIAAALVHAHGEGLIHRDIKPANVMLFMPHLHGATAEQVKLLDFGLVKNLKDEDAAEVTEPHRVRGTPQYMSPEAIRAPDEVDGRSDLYAVAAVAYYLLSGVHVFEGKSVVETLGQHLCTPAPALSSRTAARVPESLERLLMAGLEKDPARRPANARAFLEALLAMPTPEDWGPDTAMNWWRTHGESKVAALPVEEPVLTIDIRDPARH